jgi:hypothetical protein
MTDDERRTLRATFQPSSLLDALNNLDTLRVRLADSEGHHPPDIRETLTRLYALARAVIDCGQETRTRELFDLTADAQDDLFEAAASLEQIQRTLSKLADCYPKSLDEEPATQMFSDN